VVEGSIAHNPTRCSKSTLWHNGQMVHGIMQAINLERINTMANKKSRIRKRAIAIIVCLAVIALFAWAEHGLGSFQWWHVYVLVAALIMIVLVKLTPRIGRVLKYVTEYVGFEKEPLKTGGGIRRDYFMAVAPVYFIVSAYLMQAALRGNQMGTVAMILSIVMLAFALYLVVVSFYRKLSETWARATYLLASWLAVIGAALFALDLLEAIRKLVELEVNQWYVILFTCGGFLIILGIMLFHLIRVSSRE
jgi:hypothetical protein